MRDFRDAKAMAHALRAALAASGHKITVSQSLELIAKAFGAADWNTLSAAINADAGAPRQSSPVQAPSAATGPLAPGRIGFSGELEATLRRAVASANQRSHEHATLEHLLLALVDDADASAVMRACKVDLDVLRAALSAHLDNEPQTRANNQATPTAAFQRVIQRGVVHIQQSGRLSVTGANVLVALFSERESRAVHLLEEQAMTRFDAVSFIAHGIVKPAGTPRSRQSL